jgi:alanine dehydrogenase
MTVGVPREIKQDENRIGLTPAGVHEFINSGHKVLIEKNAGTGSGFSDKEFTDEGAEIVNTAAEIYAVSFLIIKVKEPVNQEIDMLKSGQIIYTYLHLAPNKPLTLSLMKKKVTAIAYETIEAEGKLVLLEPMSEVAGKIASIMGAYFLGEQHGGKGILAGGVAGVHSANFLILGGGTAGLNAAKVAAGLGARVIVMDINLERMRYLEDVLPKNCEMLMSNKINIVQEIKVSDVIIGAVLIPGAKTPSLLTGSMLRHIKPGTVLVDISVDQGGCFETSRPTTHSEPVFSVGGIIHYCVSNMPGAYPRSSTFALTNATLPFGLEIAGSGWKEACRNNISIYKGVNIAEGRITYKNVAEAHKLEYTPLKDII